MPKETLRIISGKYRHRRIEFPSSSEIRPTKDKVREAVFSSLGNINGKVFLDMYAGSGAMGLEAASRGAAKVYLIDNNSNAAKCIRDNISSLEIENVTLLEMECIDALKKLSEDNIVLDYIYLDPPYEEERYSQDLSKLYEYHLLNKDAIIVSESNKALSEDDFPSFEIFKRKNFGFINLTYFKVKV
ncbi:MAG: 16S rRNA (guanine(966)-N(2))-methyltransferase RsmD [Coprobacillus sp.]|nr:16S rRNA (guanine(966)-N(2))-methyltransferase RsmD [Coprobacillus sp.]